jgi:hypothetical protein
MLDTVWKNPPRLGKFLCAFCQTAGCIAFCSVVIDSPDIWRRLFAGFSLNLALVGLAWVTVYDLEKRILKLTGRESPPK